MHNKELNWLALQNGSDIRGVALEGIENEKVNLYPAVARAIGVGFTEWLSEQRAKLPCELKIALGHDSRLSAASTSPVNKCFSPWTFVVP